MVEIERECKPVVQLSDGLARPKGNRVFRISNGVVLNW